MSKRLETPDVTKNQMVAMATTLIAVLGTMGVDLSTANENRIVGAAIALSVVLMISDAVIRFGRALMAGKKVDNVDLGLPEFDED